LGSVEGGDGHLCLLDLGHVDKPVALAEVGGEVAHDLDVGDGAVRAKELVHVALVGLLGEVVDKEADRVAEVALRSGEATGDCGWRVGRAKGLLAKGGPVALGREAGGSRVALAVG